MDHDHILNIWYHFGHAIILKILIKIRIFILTFAEMFNKMVDDQIDDIPNKLRFSPFRGRLLFLPG